MGLVVAASMLLATGPVNHAERESGLSAQPVIASASDNQLAGDMNNIHLPHPDAIVALSQYVSQNWNISIEKSAHIVNIAFEKGIKTQVDPLLILAVISTESSFQEKSHNHVGAEGLMQVWRKWHPDLFKKMPKKLTAEQNIESGSMILAKYMVHESKKSHEFVENALQSYNGNKKDISHKYAHKVLAEKEKFKEIYTLAVPGKTPVVPWNREQVAYLHL
jgi:soluble lytic murein transglycosylase-like protein